MLAKPVVATLSYGQDKQPHSRNGFGSGIVSKDRKALSEAGITIIQIEPTTMFYTRDEPIVISHGAERRALLAAFLSSNAHIQSRWQLDVILQVNHTSKWPQQQVDEEFVLVNGVYRRSSLFPGANQSPLPLFMCRHRPQVVRQLLETSLSDLNRVAQDVFPEDRVPQRGNLIYYGQKYPRVLTRLSIATCDGCIETASRLLFALLGYHLGYSKVDVNQVWENFSRGVLYSTGRNVDPRNVGPKSASVGGW